MKKIIWLILCLTFTTCAYAIELEGGVKYNVDSAREYVQDGIPEGVDIPDKYFVLKESNVKKAVYSHNNAGEVIGITVQYINESTKAYIYSKDKTLMYIVQYDKSIDLFPRRGYRYDLNGKLDLTSLIVSPSEQFRFSPSGKLIAHSVNGVIYDENGNVIGTGK
jgi:hypothetical protein